LYLSQSGSREQYYDSRPSFRETDLELGELWKIAVVFLKAFNNKLLQIYAVVLLALCALAWCLYLSQSGSREQYYDSRPSFRETDLELGESEPQVGLVRLKSPPGILRVKRYGEVLVGVPEILQKKHFVEPPLNYTKAKQLSENRNQFCANTGEISTNTVFEANFDDPEVLIKCKVVDQNYYHGKDIVVSKTKLNTYQCHKTQGTDNWTPTPIGKRYAIFAGEAFNFHLMPNFLKFHKVIDIDENEE
jgi:hypothetical protein